MAPKICTHLKTIKTRTKCQSDAEGKVTSDRPCGCESWCERSDSCELEGQVRDQWVSRWFWVGLWWQESPGYWSLQALAHLTQDSCVFSALTSEWNAPFNLRGLAHALPALSPPGLLGEEWKPQDGQAFSLMALASPQGPRHKSWGSAIKSPPPVVDGHSSPYRFSFGPLSLSWQVS